MSTTKYRRLLERQKGERDSVKRSIKLSQESIKELKFKAENLQRAQAIIQKVAQLTQEELEYHISELVTLAMETVFPDPYELHLDFELRRGKSEADLSFSSKRSRERIDPLSASGGGPVDVAALALRVSLWNLKRPRSRNTIILDEPLRFLSRDLQLKASSMLKEISDKLNLQFIIITHEPNLLEAADRVFQVSMRKGVSYVTRN